MASKKYLELKSHSVEDLNVELSKAKSEYAQMRFDNYVKGIDSVARIREARKDIARINTELRRRALESQEGGEKRMPRLSRRQRLRLKNSN